MAAPRVSSGPARVVAAAPIVIPPPRHARARRVPRQLQPDAIRLGYFYELRRTVLARMRGLVDTMLVPELPALVSAAAMVHDAAGKKFGAYAKHVVKIVDAAAKQFFNEFTNTKLQKIALSYGQQTSKFQKQQLARQFAQGLGIDLPKSEPQLVPKLQAWATQNASLIKSVPQKYFSEIESRTLEALRTGERAEDIAADYQARYGVSEVRAMLIARDQIGKLQGQVNQARQEELGISSFTWRTVGDERVREEHEELEGQLFKWSDPPAEGIPGEPINCRCTAEPNVDEAIAKLTGEAATDIVQPVQRQQLAFPKQKKPKIQQPVVAPIARPVLAPQQLPPTPVVVVPLKFPAAHGGLQLAGPPPFVIMAAPPGGTGAAAPPPPPPPKQYPVHSGPGGKKPTYHATDRRLHADSRLQWNNKFGKPDRQAVFDYTADSTRLNNFMAGTYDPLRDPKGDQSVALQARADALDAALKKARIKEDVTTWRAMDARSLGLKGKAFDAYKLDPASALGFVQKKIGKRVTDEVYGSTSLDYDVAKSFLRNERVLLEVQIPAGSQGFYFDGDKDLTRYAGEAELLLPKCQKYTIKQVSVVTTANGKTLHLVVEVR